MHIYLKESPHGLGPGSHLAEVSDVIAQISRASYWIHCQRTGPGPQEGWRFLGGNPHPSCMSVSCSRWSMKTHHLWHPSPWTLTSGLHPWRVKAAALEVSRAYCLGDEEDGHFPFSICVCWVDSGSGFFFFFFAISKITLHDLLDANTVDLWLCWPLPCCLGPRGAFPLLVYPERFRSCSAKKGSLVLPAHGLTTCVAPALGPHALVGAWPHISDRPWSFGLPGPRHSWSLAFNRFPETPKEIPIAMCLIAQPLPAAQLCP